MKKFFTFIAAALTAMTMSAQALTVAQAMEIGMALDSAAVSEQEYTVEGYVINAGAFSQTYHNQSWYMADDASATESDFQAYNCYPIEGNDTLKVLNGDKVSVTGKLKKYWNRNASKFIIEFEKANATFISKVDGDHSTSVTTEEITIAEALEIGATLADNASTEKQYKLTGYVSAIDVEFSEQYGNESFWVTDAAGSTAASNAEGAFYVYRGKPATGEAIPVGAKVTFTTTIKKYVKSGQDPVIENTDQNIVITVEGGTPAEEADVVFGATDFAGQGASGTGDVVTATKDGVTFWCDKAFGDGQYGVRCYMHANIRIYSETDKIGKIVFEFGLDKTGGLDEEIIVNANEWAVEDLPSQARMNKISIYLGEAEKPEVVITTVAEALAIGALLEEGGKTTEKYTIEGYITQIDDDSFDTDYHNMTFWIADEAGSTAATNADGAFEVYRGKPEVHLQLGDKIRVETIIQNFYGTIESASGAKVTIATDEGIENVVLTEKAQKVVVDGVIYIVRDNKMFNLQGAQVR